MMGHTGFLFDRRFSARLAIAAAAVSLLVTATLLVLVFAAPRVTTPAGDAATTPPQLSWAARGAISTALGRDKAAFHLSARAGTLVAHNPAQGLTARFDAHGARVRTGPASFGLQLLAYGAGQSLKPVAPVPPRADANRASYSHGGLTEWYVNGPLGIEQGFDIARAPAPGPGSVDQLMLAVGLRGNMQARADGATGLLLTGPDGRQLRYTGLSATDARGRSLKTTLTVGSGRAFIHVSTAGAVYPVRVDPFIQVSKFGEQSSGGSTGLGANAISVAGDTAAVSVTLPTNPPTGAVDIFLANNGRWEQGATKVAQVTDPPDLQTGDDHTEDQFASSVALSADGRTLAVGAEGARIGQNAFGKVYVFEKPASGWTNTAAPAATAMLDNNSPPLALNGRLGHSLSISPNGSRIATGAPGFNSNTGAVVVFDEPPAGWASTQTPNAVLTTGAQGDFMGWSVALAGNTIATGAIHASNSTGAAYIFQKPGATWTQTSTISGEQANDTFGWAAAISADGHTIALTSRDHSSARGAIYVFTSANGTWPMNPIPAAVLTASNPSPGDQLGQSVVIDGNIILAGAFGTTFNNHPFTGAAFLFVEPPGGWRSEHEAQELSASDGKGGDSFGQSVGFSNGTALVASPFANASGTTNTQGFLYAFGSFPSTAISFAPAAPNGLNGWYRHPVGIAVSASDLASTVTSIRCVLDPAGAPPSFGALPAACGFTGAGAVVSANGRHVLYAAAVNSAGYAASPTSRAFQIDMVAPRVRCEPTPAFVLHGRGGLVTAQVTDATSGPAVPLIASRANVSRTGKKVTKLTGHDNAGNATTTSCRYTVVASALPTSFHSTFAAGPKFTIFDTLVALKVPKGAQLKIACTGPRCPLRRRVIHTPTTRLVCKAHHKHCKKKPAPPFTNINLKPIVGNRHFAVKDKLTLTVTKPNTIGVTQTFTIRRSANPAISGPKCLAPGSNKPGKGC
jgi:hypothetical protein